MKKKFAAIMINREYRSLSVLMADRVTKSPMLVSSERQAKKMILDQCTRGWELFGLIDDPTPYFEVVDEK